MENGQIEKKKRVFSAIKPTGNPTLGNYLGTMQYWGGMADEYDCLFSVADLHAITVAIEPKDLRENSKRLFALLILIGRRIMLRVIHRVIRLMPTVTWDNVRKW